MEWKDPPYEITKGFAYKTDGRLDPDPDDERLDVFTRGWAKAVDPEQEDYGETAFAKLSWHNLGYRLGLLFGETSPALKAELYTWCVRQMRESNQKPE
jgi:hypothetical protein